MKKLFISINGYCDVFYLDLGGIRIIGLIIALYSLYRIENRAELWSFTRRMIQANRFDRLFIFQ